MSDYTNPRQLKRKDAERIFRNIAKLEEKNILSALENYDKIAQLNNEFNKGFYERGAYHHAYPERQALHKEKARHQANLIKSLITKYLSEQYKAKKREFNNNRRFQNELAYYRYLFD